MFITRKRLNQIKEHERHEKEREMYRDREIYDLNQRIWRLEGRITALEKNANPITTCPATVSCKIPDVDITV